MPLLKAITAAVCKRSISESEKKCMSVWSSHLSVESAISCSLESEYIVGVGLFPNPTDTLTLIPFLERIQQGSKRKYENIIADSGYASEENYTYLEQQGQKAYIKPADHEVRKKKKFKNDRYRIENMPYDEEKD